MQNMEKISRKRFVLLLLMALIGCSRSEENVISEVREGVEYISNLSGLDTTRFPLRFELEQIIGVEEGSVEESIAGIRSMAVDNMGNVYVLDDRNSRLMAFDSAGNHLWNASRQGEGPGELSAPRKMALLGDQLHVSNQRGTRIDAWNTSGEYLGTIPIPQQVGSSATFEGYISDTMVFSTGTPKAVSTTLWFFDAHSRALLDSLTFRQEMDQIIPGQISQTMYVDVTQDNVVIAGATSDYVFWTMNRLGMLEREVRLNADHLWGPSVIENMFIPYIGIRKMLSLPGGEEMVFVMVPNTDPAESMRRRMAGEATNSTGSLTSLDLFDPKGIYQGSMIRHDGHLAIGTPHHVGQDGKLYTTVQTPYPAIRRYRVLANQGVN